MKKSSRFMGAALLLTLAQVSFVHAEDDLGELRGQTVGDKWTLLKEDKLKNIRIWIKHEEGKRLRPYRLSAVLDAPVDKVLETFHDFDNFPRWFYGVKDARLLKQISPTEYYYYRVHRAPLGLPDRDVVIHATVEPLTAKHPYVSIHRVAEPDYLPKQPKMERMPIEDSVTTLKPLNDRQSLWEIEGYVDPGGNAPAWAINAIQRNAPYYSALGLQRYLGMQQK